MANIDNYKIKTLMTECSRKKGPGVVNQLPQQPFSISKHKAFYSFGGNYWEVAKINGYEEFECKVPCW